MTHEYQPYEIDGIETLLRTKLDQALQAHETVCEEHRRVHLPTYENYPYRDANGRPQWKDLSAHEHDELLRVKWPTLIRLIVPSLRDKALVTGAEVMGGSLDQGRADRSFFGSISSNLKRQFKLYAWKRWKKDDYMYLKALQTRHQEYRMADDAWFELQHRLPHLPWRVEGLQTKMADLEKFKEEQKTAKPVVWLTDEEHATLRQAFLDGDIDKVYDAMHLVFYNNRASEIRFREFIDTWHELMAPYHALEEMENPKLLGKIKAVLKKDPHGEFLLDLAEKDGLQFHFQRRKEGTPRTPYDPGAHIYHNDVYLIDAEETNIGDQAVSLGHELRHHWQDKTFEPFFKDHNSNVDSLVRTRLVEADAYAVMLSIAFVLKEQGVEISWWDSNPESHTGSFEKLYRECVDHYKVDTEQALNHTTSAFFILFTGPGTLDVYERKLSFNAESIHDNEDLPKLIAESPYSQPDFIARLTTIEGIPYLADDRISMVQEQLQQIGRSEHAQPVRRPLQPIKFAL